MNKELLSTYISNQKTVRGITYICSERVFDSQPFMYNKIFLQKTFKGACSPLLYTSFGTFCTQNVQSFEAQ